MTPIGRHSPPRARRLAARVARLATCVAAAVSAAACGGGAPTATPSVPSAPRLEGFPTGDRTTDQSTLDSLKQYARSRARRDGCARDQDCAVVGLGAKPCGGPWEHLVYCRATTDEPALRAAVARVDTAERRFNERYGVASTCDVTREATPALQGGSCVAK